MKETFLVYIIYILYQIIQDRGIFFKIIYTISLAITFPKLLSFLFSKSLTINTKFTSVIKYILSFLISHVFIKEPNPIYHLLTFYLPIPYFFRSIFIIIFITYILNIKIIKSPEKKYFLSDFISSLYKNKKKLFLFFSTLIISKLLIYFYNLKYWIYFTPKNIALPSDTNNNTKYYISSVLFNIEPIAFDWITQMKLLINYLGKENVIISIIENGDSTDNTRKYLSEFRDYLNNEKILNSIVIDPIIIRGKKERIVFLSELRDLSMDFLYKIKNINFKNTKIIFFNDIIYRYSDIIKLLSTNNGEYDSVCAMDYYEGFYDTWASQLNNGVYFGRMFPYLRNPEGQEAVLNGEIIRTFSCWNGVTVFNATPFEDKILYFRHGTKIRQSECTLLHFDMYFMGYLRTLVNTDVKVTYTYEYYYKNHYVYPWSKHLMTYFYYYFKYAIFKRRSKSLTNLKDRNVKVTRDFEELLKMYLSK